MDEALRELGFWDRREVRRAVARGRAVPDLRLAPAAAIRARRIEEVASRWSWRAPTSWPSFLSACLRAGAGVDLLAVATAFELFFNYRSGYLLVLAGAGVLALVFRAVRCGRRTTRLAARARYANRSLFEDLAGR